MGSIAKERFVHKIMVISEVVAKVRTVLEPQLSRVRQREHFRIMKQSSCIALLLLTLVSCKDQGIGPPSDAYERWRSYGLHSYTIDQTRSCFCVNGGQIMRVTVRKDTVACVLRLSDTTQLSSSNSRLYLTVDSLFGLIRYRRGDSLVVTYNPRYGYPERLDINPQLHPVDGGVLYETANLQLP